MRIQNPIVSTGTRYVGPATSKTFVMVRKHSTPILDRYHGLWAELHSGQIQTLEQFEAWLQRVPNADCGCRQWLKDYVANNPFSAEPRWGFDLHDAVNRKLEKPEFTWEAFVALETASRD